MSYLQKRTQEWVSMRVSMLSMIAPALRKTIICLVNPCHIRSCIDPWFASHVLLHCCEVWISETALVWFWP